MAGLHRHSVALLTTSHQRSVYEHTFSVCINVYVCLQCISVCVCVCVYVSLALFPSPDYYLSFVEGGVGIAGQTSVCMCEGVCECV